MIKLIAFCAALLSFAPGSTTWAKIEPPVLRLSLETEPLTLDWNALRSSSDHFILSFLMRGMLKYDLNAQPVCDLCRSFHTSADGKTVTFELNPTEIWSDGERLEAKHFVNSFHRLMNPANGYEFTQDLHVIEGAVQKGRWDLKKLGIRAEGSSKLVISLNQASSVFPHLMTTAAVFPLRTEFLKKGKEGGEKHVSNAVLGPYLLAAWERGKRIVIEGNPKFSGLRPVYRVEFILGKHSELVTKFKVGKLDVLSNPTTEDLLQTKKGKLQVFPYWATHNLIFNLKKSSISKLPLRRSILYALERESLPAFLGNGERKATGLIPPGLVGFRELPLVTPEISTSEAERMRAGSKAQEIELKLLVRDSELERKTAQWIGEQLKKIQIRIKTTAEKSASYYSALKSGKFDLALTTWVFDITSPMQILKSFQTRSSLNWGHWANVAFDGLLEKLGHESDAAKAALLVEQASQIIEVQDVGAIPLGYPSQPFLLGPRVTAFSVTPFGDPDLVKIQLSQ